MAEGVPSGCDGHEKWCTEVGKTADSRALPVNMDREQILEVDSGGLWRRKPAWRVVEDRASQLLAYHQGAHQCRHCSAFLGPWNFHWAPGVLTI